MKCQFPPGLCNVLSVKKQKTANTVVTVCFRRYSVLMPYFSSLLLFCRDIHPTIKLHKTHGAAQVRQQHRTQKETAGSQFGPTAAQTDLSERRLDRSAVLELLLQGEQLNKRVGWWWCCSSQSRQGGRHCTQPPRPGGERGQEGGRRQHQDALSSQMAARRTSAALQLLPQMFGAGFAGPARPENQTIRLLQTSKER